ncbi:MAG: 5-formyltetrahydrofolate cyclo-ligase [Flavobacteriaceae bacterium]|nr:5-formyltetrahydrofolate cyclo-ligase [Flavobacteriaceae bacterium]
MDKSFYRKRYQQRRESSTSHQRDTWSLEIANRLLELSIWDHVYYHLFLTIERKKEIDTSYLLHILQGKDKEVVVSRSNIDRSLTNILLTDNTKFAYNKWNIPEPQNGVEVPTNLIDVIFVPLLAFDQNGHRIGYGKGYYDNFLSNCRANALTIGLSFFPPIEESIPVEAHDKTLDCVVTPQEVYRF